MQRLVPSLAAALSVLTLTLAPACKSDKPADDKPADKQPEVVDQTEAETGEIGPSRGEAGQPVAGEAGAADDGEAPAADEGGANEGGADEGGAAVEAGTGEPAPDVVAGLFEQAKNIATDDATAQKALNDAIAAGATKIDAAKIAYARGEALMADGEAERAETFYRWAADAHKLYAEPIYKLATLAAYAGDLEIAKEHLQELQKRGNKKLMKKVGVDPAFALLHDDPDVRKIYER
jgi:predicted outer membrane protein